MNGFYNLGNTCFLNAGLQLLINNEKLNNLILNTNTEDKFINTYKRFIKTYKAHTNKILKPNFIKNYMGEHYDIFLGTKQQDSDEFLNCFFNLINKTVKTDDLFNINIKSIVKCKALKCLNKSITETKSTKLILNILNNMNTLDDCYRFFKISERLEEDNMVYCEKCEKKRIVSIKSEIDFWPECLIINLKRFSNNGRLSKNNKKIEIPLLWRKGYKLKGGIVHSGNLFGGHYIYFGLFNNKWYLYNDTTVSELNLESLNKLKDYGYIFYYCKN